jgi:hypothetical protein
VQVFEGVEPLVTSALDGYDVCECACVRVRVCVRSYARVRAFVYACARVRVRAFVCACARVRVRACMRACASVCLRAFSARACACMCMRVFGCVDALPGCSWARVRTGACTPARSRAHVYVCSAPPDRTGACADTTCASLRTGRPARARRTRCKGRTPTRASTRARCADSSRCSAVQHVPTAAPALCQHVASAARAQYNMLQHQNQGRFERSSDALPGNAVRLCPNPLRM